MASNPDCPYIFVVSTNMYAGNYEREMTAFMTGVVGECEVGDEQIEIFREEMEEAGLDPDMFEDQLSQQSDDRGCYRPCSIWNLKGEDGYNSNAIFFDSKPSKEQLDVLVARANKYAAEYGGGGKMQINKCELIKRKKTTVDTVIPF